MVVAGPWRAARARRRGSPDPSAQVNLSSAMLLYDSSVSGNCYKVRLLTFTFDSAASGSAKRSASSAPFSM